MKKLIFLFLFFWTLTPAISQSEPIIAYHHKAKDFQEIMLLDCNVGYYYSGPHLFIDEVFSFQIKGDKLIRTFDPDHSFKQRVDTLLIKKNSIQDINGLSFKKVKTRKRNNLIERYIHPIADIGVFEIFLERIGACQDKK